MKFFETKHYFESSWEAVTLACWRKYPNDKTPHVKHVEILSREVDSETGILKTERLIMVSQKMPRILQRIFGADDCTYALEYSEVDPKQKTMVLKSVNLTFQNLMVISEKIDYRLNPTNLNQTQFTQSATLNAEGLMSRFASLVEEHSLKVFINNAKVGMLGFEQVLEKILSEQKAQATL
ncbi:hypothetical protein BB561_002234 [Smittium simulii]|uniref:PRELI/MSF1 domain-containing protein n=1 Tax=Smittium simulii TaxID=133385 RepID=A0A2T9YR63_9FUNG|nr:hypothetical protein BB561_002234 [Smittium simulii]